MRKNNLKIIIAFIIAFLLGLLLQFSNPLQALLIMFILLFLVFFSLIILVIGLFSKKFRIWYIVGFVPIVVAYSFTTLVRNYKHKKAIEINANLNFSKKRMGNTLKL